MKLNCQLNLETISKLYTLVSEIDKGTILLLSFFNELINEERISLYLSEDNKHFLKLTLQMQLCQIVICVNFLFSIFEKHMVGLRFWVFGSAVRTPAS